MFVTSSPTSTSQMFFCQFCSFVTSSIDLVSILSELCSIFMPCAACSSCTGSVVADFIVVIIIINSDYYQNDQQRVIQSAICFFCSRHTSYLAFSNIYCTIRCVELFFKIRKYMYYIKVGIFKMYTSVLLPTYLCTHIILLYYYITKY